MVSQKPSNLVHLLHELLRSLPEIEDRYGKEGVKRQNKLIRHYQQQYEVLSESRKWPPVS